MSTLLGCWRSGFVYFSSFVMRGFILGEHAPVERFVLRVVFAEDDGGFCFGEFVAEVERVRGIGDVEVIE